MGNKLKIILFLFSALVAVVFWSFFSSFYPYRSLFINGHRFIITEYILLVLFIMLVNQFLLLKNRTLKGIAIFVIFTVFYLSTFLILFEREMYDFDERNALGNSYPLLNGLSVLTSLLIIFINSKNLKLVLIDNFILCAFTLMFALVNLYKIEFIDWFPITLTFLATVILYIREKVKREIV